MKNRLALLLIAVASLFGGCRPFSLDVEPHDTLTDRLQAVTADTPAFGGVSFRLATEPRLDSLVVYILEADSLPSAQRVVDRMFVDHQPVLVERKPPNPCGCGGENEIRKLRRAPGVVGIGPWHEGYGTIYVASAKGVVDLERRMRELEIPPGAFRVGVQIAGQ